MKLSLLLPNQLITKRYLDLFQSYNMYLETRWKGWKHLVRDSDDQRESSMFCVLNFIDDLRTPCLLFSELQSCTRVLSILPRALFIGHLWWVATLPIRFATTSISITHLSVFLPLIWNPGQSHCSLNHQFK